MSSSERKERHDNATLGMDEPISRRDYLNFALLASGSLPSGREKLRSGRSIFRSCRWDRGSASTA